MVTHGYTTHPSSYSPDSFTKHIYLSSHGQISHGNSHRDHTVSNPNLSQLHICTLLRMCVGNTWGEFWGGGYRYSTRRNRRRPLGRKSEKRVSLLVNNEQCDSYLTIRLEKGHCGRNVDCWDTMYNLYIPLSLSLSLYIYIYIYIYITPVNTMFVQL
jgi:hypothetical protein